MGPGTAEKVEGPALDKKKGPTSVFIVPFGKPANNDGPEVGPMKLFRL
jgi:hypothetical protein